MSTEYLLLIILQVLFFGDIGQTWAEEQPFTGENFNSAMGLGVRMNTPIGQLRFDYAYNFNENKFRPHFSIGQTF